ncbi:160_t:CDS:2, partial [Funneliformis caledonium]
HVREASQASGEIIFNGELEDGKCVTIQEGNYDSSSQQMEYAILIAIIKKILTILEKYNIKLNVGVDRDLSTNKTLALLNVVN